MSDSQIGVTGLAVMGANLARNAAHKGFTVAVHNRTAAKTEEFFQEHGQEGAITPSTSIETFVAALARPRAIMIMVKAGAPVDAVIEESASPSGEGRPADRRRQLLLRGYAPAHPRTGRAWAALPGRRRLRRRGGRPCRSQHDAGRLTRGLRPRGADLHKDGRTGGRHALLRLHRRRRAGHYVKMVHNGIEYADMQLIAEAYDLLHTGLGLGNDELAETFATWNKGDLDSFLIEITAAIFRKSDERPASTWWIWCSMRPPRRARASGPPNWLWTWASPVTAITEAVFARGLSALKDRAGGRLESAARPARPSRAPGDQAQFINDVRDALYGAKVVAYAQGFQQMARRRRRVQVGPAHGRTGHHLARWLHHQGQVPGPHP